MFSSSKLDRFNTAMNECRSTALDHCLTNDLFGENGKDFLPTLGLVDFDKECFDVTKDICIVLIDIDVANLEEEFDSPLKTSDD